jgi:hypothetical protein
MSQPNFSFCGYPVRILGGKWQPCGSIATDGCAYCDRHAEWPEPNPTNVQSVLAYNTAIAKTQPWWFSLGWILFFLLLIAAALYQPVHDYLHTHTLGFFAGMFAGAVLELAIILAARWTWHRFRWIRWFNRMG